MIVQTIILHKINNVEFICSIFSCVRDTEVEPLSIAPSVLVWFEYQIVLIFINLNDSP